MPSGDDRNWCSLFLVGKPVYGALWYNQQRQNNGAAAILKGDLRYLFFVLHANVFRVQNLILLDDNLKTGTKRCVSNSLFEFATSLV